MIRTIDILMPLVLTFFIRHTFCIPWNFLPFLHHTIDCLINLLVLVVAKIMIVIYKLSSLYFDHPSKWTIFLLQIFKCRLHEERRLLSLLRRRGRERHLPQVQQRKFVTLFFSFPEGPKKNFSKYFGPDL